MSIKNLIKTNIAKTFNRKWLELENLQNQKRYFSQSGKFGRIITVLLYLISSLPAKDRL